MSQEIYDLAVIGAGPAGCLAAFFGWRRGKKIILIEMHHTPGGQINKLWPEKYAYDIPGIPKIIGKELARGFVAQGTNSPLYWDLLERGKAPPPLPTLVKRERVIKIQRVRCGSKKYWQITTEKLRYIGDEIAEVLGNEIYPARAILITAGLGTGAIRKFDQEDFARFEGQGLFYGWIRKEEVVGKKVLVVGGGDTAVDLSFQLYEAVDSLILIHRRDEFRATEKAIVESLKSAGCVKTPYLLVEIAGSLRVEGAWIKNIKTGAREFLELDAIVACLGQELDTSIFASWGLELDRRGFIKVTRSFRTNLPRVYAAGEITNRRTWLIAFDATDAARAILVALHDLYPKESVYPEYSTSV